MNGNSGREGNGEQLSFTARSLYARNYSNNPWGWYFHELHFQLIELKYREDKQLAHAHAAAN